ncbi:hypothetical protein [Streptomyces sp. NPDC055992]|uniref:hypothetical protein n=1 Tax=Streptomyces sp. NPDC055992 TaxID=3345673 RepID=UPI0035D5D902
MQPAVGRSRLMNCLPADPRLPRATSEARHLELGESECTGSCCGFLSVVVQRLGDIVQ